MAPPPPGRWRAAAASSSSLARPPPTSLPRARRSALSALAPRALQGPYIANRRTARIQKQYSEIGGKSPIGDWTRYQGERLAAKLNVRW